MSGFTEIETYRFDVPEEWYALDLTDAVSPRQVAEKIKPKKIKNKKSKIKIKQN